MESRVKKIVAARPGPSAWVGPAIARRPPLTNPKNRPASCMAACHKRHTIFGALVKSGYICLVNDETEKMKQLIACFLLVFGFVMASTGAFAQTTPAAQPKASVMKWKETKKNMGKLTQNQPQPYTFEFTNTGKTPIILTNVQGSCGCTATDYTKEPVMPGKVGKVTATYNAATMGAFTKTVTVTSNTGEPATVLTIEGEVIAPPANAN